MSDEAADAVPEDSPEQVTEAEALDRMQKFVERKEAFVRAIKTGKDRDISAG